MNTSPTPKAGKRAGILAQVPLQKRRSASSSRRTEAGDQRAILAKARAMAKARVVAPAVSPHIGSTPATTFRGNPDIFGRLVEDHDRHRALLAMIAETNGASPERERLFRELAHEIKGHAAAEDQALWSAVLRDPRTTEDARHAVAEHHDMDKLLADLAARDMGTAGWMRRFAKLREEYLHHIREEEQEQFLAAQQHLRLTDIRHMRQVFEQRKRVEKRDARVQKKIRLKD